MNDALHTPVVPDQLRQYMDDDYMVAHERWQDISLGDLAERMPDAVETEFGKAAILEPAGNEYRDTVVVGLPHQQGWKPSMYARAKYMQDTVAPESRIVVLPNNAAGDRNYHFDAETAAAVRGGNLTPYYEQRARLLDAIGVEGKVDLTGYSLGGLTVVGMAGVLSDRWQPRVVNSDEAPNAQRTPGELRSDFLGSGGIGIQRRAIVDADVPAINQALNRPRLLRDYAQFGFGTFIAENRALADGMATPEFNRLVGKALAGPAELVKIGNVEDSLVFRAEADDLASVYDDERLHRTTYTSAENRKHATGDNAAAHALMLKEALTLLDQTDRI